jgi:hypothetical protein
VQVYGNERMSVVNKCYPFKQGKDAPLDFYIKISPHATN